MSKPELKVTPEVVAEFIPCDEAKKLIQDAWEAKHPGKYGNYTCTGSGWYVEVPAYMDYLVKAGKTNLARRVLDALLDDESDQNEDLLYKLWRVMTRHRLGYCRLSVDEVDELLERFEYL